MLDFDRIKQELSSPAAAPLHARLYTAINNQILDGTLQSGEALPSERILHNSLDISRSTVRQAMRSLINDGVLQSVPGAGNFIQKRKQDLSESKLVGILVSGPAFYIYYAQLASAMSLHLRQAGYRVDTGVHNENTETIGQIIESFLAQNVAAVAVHSPILPGIIEPYVEQLLARNVKVVMVSRRIAHPVTDYVGADNEQIGQDAVRYLLNSGHMRIVHICDPYYSTGRERSAGYIKAMRDAGLLPRLFKDRTRTGAEIPANLIPFLEPNDLDNLWEAIQRREVTAAFCFNDETAIKLQKELEQRNISVPHDLSIVSVDNLPFSESYGKPLTTFAQPGEEMGHCIADLIIRRTTGDFSPAQQILLPSQLIERSSTARLQ